MSSTPITSDELLKRGWDYDSIRDSFGIGECEFVLRCASSELPHEFEGGRWYLEFFSAVIYMSTIEELYAHLYHFGLIEPEPITEDGLLAMGFKQTPDGVFFVMVDDERWLSIKPGEPYTALQSQHDVAIVQFENKSIKDLRDLFRLMGVTQ